VDDLDEGEQRPRYVPVSAIPLKLETTVLDLSIALEPNAPLTNALDSSLADGLRAWRQRDFEAPIAPDDVAALLDAMQLGLPGQEAGFASARADEDWDQLLAIALEDPERSRLSESFARWHHAGRAALFSTHAFEGRVSSSPDTTGQALVVIDRVAGASAEQAGLDAEQLWSWEADAFDRIALGGALAWTPSKLSAALAIAPALAETGALSVVDALAKVYSCPVVGQTLDDASPQPGATSTTCDAACLDALCRTALSAIWDRVRLYSGTARERLELTAVGDATVGNQAQAVTLEGRWAGRLTSSIGATTGGTLHGWAPRTTSK
jgi:hypothetical protein